MEKEKRNKILKGIYILVVLVILLGLLVLLIMLMSDRDVSEMKKFNDCLAEEGVIIYGNEWCPFCTRLVEKLGGYEATENIYIDQMKNPEKYNEGVIDEKGVPQIHINGEVYTGLKDLDWFERMTGCEIPN